MAKNALIDLVSPETRKKAYLVYTLAIILQGAAAIGFATAGVDAPQWIEVVNQITLYLGGAFGLTAAANTYVEHRSAGRHAATEEEVTTEYGLEIG